MLNFKEELAKFEPILELDHIENSIRSSEVQDILDILQHISKDIKDIDYSENEK